MKLKDKIKYLSIYFGEDHHGGTHIFAALMYKSSIIDKQMFLKLKMFQDTNWRCHDEINVTGSEANKGILYYELCYKIVKEYDRVKSNNLDNITY